MRLFGLASLISFSWVSVFSQEPEGGLYVPSILLRIRDGAVVIISFNVATGKDKSIRSEDCIRLSVENARWQFRIGHNAAWEDMEETRNDGRYVPFLLPTLENIASWEDSGCLLPTDPGLLVGNIEIMQAGRCW